MSNWILATSDLSDVAEESGGNVSQTVTDAATDVAEDTVDKVASGALDQLDLVGQLFSVENLQNILVIGVRILVVVLMTVLVYRGLKLVIERSYKTRSAKLDAAARLELATAMHLVQSVVFYGCIIVAAIGILSIIGFDMRALAASAGIAGAALVLVSQSVIKDWVSGLFVIIERQFNVGDVVEVAGIVGKVKSTSIRSTVLEGSEGQLYYIPNGNISTVINYSRNPHMHAIDVGVSYDANLADAKAALTVACERVNETFADTLLKPCVVAGVQELGASAVVLRIAYYSSPFDRFPIDRALREQAKLALDEAGVEIPYDNMTIHVKNDTENLEKG